MVLLSTSAPSAVLAAGSGNQLPLVIFTVVVIGLAAIAAALSLRKG